MAFTAHLYLWILDNSLNDFYKSTSFKILKKYISKEGGWDLLISLGSLDQIQMVNSQGVREA